MLYFSVNGIQSSHIELNDRGFAYGDGIFTTAKILNGNIQQLSAHIARLSDGCDYLNIHGIDYDALQQEVISEALKYKLAVLKIIISAGCGGRGYSRIGAASPTVVVSVHDYPNHYDGWQKDGITLGDCLLKIGHNPLMKGIKHLNRLEQVLIRQELDKREENELVVYDLNNQIVEASAGNIFWITDNTIYTPDLSNAGVNGLMRAMIIERCSEIERLKPVDFITSTRACLDNADSIFICNSVMGIVPIKRYNGKPKSLAPVFKLQSLLNNLL